MPNGVPTISTHVLDMAHGRPASGVAIAVSITRPDGGEEAIKRSVTDLDGRVADLLGRGLEAGTYRLRFEIRDRSPFFGALSVELQVGDTARSYHVPLLLSPFGLSTYLGS